MRKASIHHHFPGKPIWVWPTANTKQGV
nr:hypothetical protein [Klebsiella pneumoniae subsp. pneumoniae]